MFHLFEPDVN